MAAPASSLGGSPVVKVVIADDNDGPPMVLGFQLTQVMRESGRAVEITRVISREDAVQAVTGKGFIVKTPVHGTLRAHSPMQPDVTFLDNQMFAHPASPIAKANQGIEAVREIRSVEEQLHSPRAVVVSHSADSEQDFSKEPFDAVLPKPAIKNRLIEILKTFKLL